MDFSHPTDMAAPAPMRTWPTRLAGAGVMLLCLLLLSALISFDMGEMGWSFLNPAGGETASARPCTNLLGVCGLYIAGLLYWLLGAGAIYAVLLAGMIGGGMLIHPYESRAGQWICLFLMLCLACAALAVQDVMLSDWASTHSQNRVGGSLGYLWGTCIAEALLGPTYALALLVLLHALIIVLFARLTYVDLFLGIKKDCARIAAAHQARQERKRLEKETQAAEWKRQQEEEARARAEEAAAARAAAEARGHVPQQTYLPIHTAPQPQPQPAVKPNRPPLQIPPRPVQPPALQPAPAAETRPAPQAPLPPRQRTAVPPTPAPAPEPTPTPAPLSTHETRRSTRTSRPDPIVSKGDDLLDLMGGIEEDIVRSSFTGRAPATEPVPRESGSGPMLKPEFQDQVHRHMGIATPQPEPRRTPPRKQPPAPMPKPEPVHEEEEEPTTLTDYPFPPYDLLNYTPPSAELAQAAHEESLSVQQCLIDTFATFNITMEPGEITRGPSLTRYEFYPPRGLRLNRIANLGNDLMLATQTKSVNILAPIPGKNTVGVELENATKESVYLRELLESPAFHNPKLKIPVALGKNVYGEPVIGDLAAMPHALVAGTTGSGKSVCINSMILSMLYKFRPDELRLVLVDPKVVEMQPYRKLPHLACPVVTNPARVIGALRWAVNEMEHRYKMFSKLGVRNFEDFNNRPEDYVPEPEDDEEEIVPYDPHDTSAADAIVSDIERSNTGDDLPEETQDELDFDAGESIPAKLPYIVIIIDELADLMMVVKEDLENYIARLTQKARAAGIHLVAATQTPRSNVVTGLIKANIPCRIALKVASPLDSRIILDTNGAENLLGKGDLLFLPPGGITKITRAQGAWVSDAEIAAIIKFCAAHAKQSFDRNVTAEMNNADGSGPGGPGSDGENGRLAGSKIGGEEDDELYTRCVNLVVTERKASTSLLQRRFSIGYGRAAKIMDMMEARGVISSPQGATRAREVLVETPEN